MSPGGRRRNLRLDRRAVTAVEFALVATPMLFLILGTIEFGRFLWTMQALQSAASQGARCMAVLNPSCASGGAYSQANTVRYIKGLAQAWGVPLTSDQITLSRSASIGTIAGFSEASLSYSFQSVVSGFLPGLTGSQSLTGQAFVPNWQ